MKTALDSAVDERFRIARAIGDVEITAAETAFTGAAFTYIYQGREYEIAVRDITRDGDDE